MPQLEIQCNACKNKLQIEVNGPHLMNFETASSILFEHSGEMMCGCGAVVVPVIAFNPQNQIVVSSILVPPEQRKKLVYPAGNGRIGKT
jgi:hypothetical protein